jgi:long-chain acyl-CoA synthetase
LSAKFCSFPDSPVSALVNLGDILRLPTLSSRLAYVDLRVPDAPRRCTAAELDALIVAVARGLRRRGISPGDRVGILSQNRLEFVLGYFGCLRAGAVAVPINYRLPASTVAHVFRDSGIGLALADAARAALVPTGTPLVNFDARGGDGFEELLDPGADPKFEPAADDLAEILYTSGSTGLPKGVPLDHRGQLWALERYLQPLDEDQPQRCTLVVAPLYHMNGLFFSCVALASRTTLITMPRFEARVYLEAVASWRCAVLSGIPTMFALMVRERDLVERLDFSSVREISIGSAPLTDALLGEVQRTFPNATIRNGYGTTEVGPGVFGPHPDSIPTPPLSLGVPMPGVECALVDGVTPDEGVLAVRTPALMRGYLNLPDVTAARMRDGYYLTGDVMRRDRDGFHFFVGRADDMFVCGGENVYPGEVEKLLERHPDVAQAAVVSAPDDVKGAIPVAFVVPRPGATLDSEALRRYALDHGPAYAHPRFILLREELPVAGTHKIDRSSLAAEAVAVVRAAGRLAAP